MRPHRAKRKATMQRTPDLPSLPIPALWRRVPSTPGLAMLFSDPQERYRERAGVGQAPVEPATWGRAREEPVGCAGQAAEIDGFHIRSLISPLSERWSARAARTRLRPRETFDFTVPRGCWSRSAISW